MSNEKDKSFSDSNSEKTIKLVKEYYESYGVKEWKRLVKDAYHKLEFDTTMYFLRKYLPRKGLVLDAGGGPGRYTIELAKQGYDVILLDLTPKLLEIARRRIKREKVQDRVKQIIEGSVDDLSMFSDESFDAVMSLGGVLSHLVDKKRRQKAILELKRVAKKEAPIFISVIGRLHLPVGWLFLWGEAGHAEFLMPHVDKLMKTGDYYGGYGFAPAHFYLPEELKGDCESAGLDVLELVGLEGLVTGHEREVNKLAKKRPDVWNKWKKMHLSICTHPTSVGISEHMLIICKKQNL